MFPEVLKNLSYNSSLSTPFRQCPYHFDSQRQKQKEFERDIEKMVEKEFVTSGLKEQTVFETDIFKNVMKEYCTYLKHDKINNFRFKVCIINNDPYFVFLRISEFTQTNENRQGIINPLYALYHANEVFVEKIILLSDSVFKFTSNTNETNKKIQMDDNLNGIHYCNSIIGAFYFQNNIFHILSKNYTGIWKKYSENGELIEIIKISEGKILNKYQFKYM